MPTTSQNGALAAWRRRAPHNDHFGHEGAAWVGDTSRRRPWVDRLAPLAAVPFKVPSAGRTGPRNADALFVGNRTSTARASRKPIEAPTIQPCEEAKCSEAGYGAEKQPDRRGREANAKVGTSTYEEDEPEKVEDVPHGRCRRHLTKGVQLRA